MNKVKVEKQRLLAALSANSKKHRKAFLKAQAGYRAEVIEQLDKALKNARDGKKIRTVFHLPAPVDQTPEYTTAIEMLMWEVGDTVTIDHQAFRQYVLDDWHWKRDWMHSNHAYLTKKV